MHSTVCWLGMQIIVPADWEIIKHSISTGTGFLSFVDRTTQKMQISWTKCLSRPDINRIFSDFRSRDLADYPKCTLSEVVTFGMWRFYVRTVNNKIITRAGCYDQKLKRWIDLVFLWSDERDISVEKIVLSGYKALKPKNNKIYWNAFNMNFAVPVNWNLVQTEIFPANILMTFEHGKSSVSLARIGIPEGWFDGHIENFLKKRVGDDLGDFSYKNVNSHEVCMFTGKEKMFHPRWVLGKRYYRQDTAWFCKESNAVFHISVKSLKNERVDISEFPVRCCKKGVSY